MLKKYKLWYLICASLFLFISANWVMYALTGLTFIRAGSDTQGFTQALTWVLTGIATPLFEEEGQKNE